MAIEALILVEGETELEFLGAIADLYFPKSPKKIRNLHGNWSINRKVIDKALAFHQTHPGRAFFVCVCIDRERANLPNIDVDLVKRELKAKGVDIEIIPIIANLMTESLFFADVSGIFSFLRAPNAQRKPEKYAIFRRLTHRDLNTLFQRFNKTYIKGKRVANFVSNLNIQTIVGKCAELQLLVKTCGGDPNKPFGVSVKNSRTSGNQ